MSTTNGQQVEQLQEYADPIRFKIGDKDYLIPELDGSKEYWDWLKKFGAFISVEHTPDENMDQLPGIQAEFITMCLRTADNTPVSRETVNKFGLRLKKRLFDLCCKQNMPTEEATQTEGKDLGNAETATGGSALPSNSHAPLVKPSPESVPASSSVVS